MQSPINETREQILDVAQDLLQRRSIAEVSFQDLATVVGIKKGSLYYHFESKDALTVAVLARAQDQFLSAMRAVEALPPRQQLRRYIDIFGRHFGATQKMCPAGAFAALWDSQSEPVQHAVRLLIDTHRRVLESLIARARTDNLLRQSQRSDRELAIWTVATLQGAMATARIMGDAEWFDLSMRQTEEALFGTA